MSCEEHQKPYLYIDSKTEELLCEDCAKNAPSSLSIITIALCQSHHANSIQATITSILNEISQADSEIPEQKVNELMKVITGIINAKMSPKLIEFFGNISKLVDRLKDLQLSVTQEKKEIDTKLEEKAFLTVVNKKVMLESMQKEVNMLSELQMSYYKGMLELMNNQFFNSLQVAIKEAIFKCLNIEFTVKTADCTPGRNSNISLPQLDTPNNCIPIASSSMSKKRVTEDLEEDNNKRPKQAKKVEKENNNNAGPITKNQEAIVRYIIESDDLTEIKKKIQEMVVDDCMYIIGLDLGQYTSEEGQNNLDKLLKILEWSPYMKLLISKLKCTKEVFAQIMIGIKKCQKLKKIKMANMVIPSMNVINSMIKDTQMEFICFSKCVIEALINKRYPEGFQLIYASSPMLKTVEMRECGLNDDCANEIKEAIMKSKNLVKLNLMNNEITKSGCKFIMNAFAYNNTLDTIDLRSNLILSTDRLDVERILLKRKRPLQIKI